MTKAYTIVSLIREVSALSVNQVKSYNTLANNLSPRARSNSAKMCALNAFLNGHLPGLVTGSNAYTKLGNTARTRIVRSLRNRKNTGSIFG